MGRTRGLGLRAPLPDVVGLGLRLTGTDGPQDLLLDSYGRGRFTRHVLTSRRHVDGGPFGTLVALTLRHGGTRFHVGALPRRGADAGRLFDLATASPYGPWTLVGTVECLGVAADQTTRMSPANTGLGVTLSPWWHDLRARSYRASREGATR